LLHDVTCGCSRSSRRNLIPTPRAQEPSSTSPGYGDSLNDFANRVATGYATKDLLRTPTASQGEGGALGEEEARKRGNTVGIRDQAMDLAKLNGSKVSREVDNYLATPQARDSKGRPGRSEDRNLNHDVAVNDLSTNWGKFESAIRRWEEVLGRPAPAPTKPDGKDGAHRLSSAFTEFMMGLEPGWITDVGLTRNEELKACGNGVVPQQAELALRILLEGVALPKAGGGMTMFPTPTVSDTFTDNLASTQQKEGSMHSVTLPQAVRMVSGTMEAGQELSTLDPRTDNQSIGSLKFTAEDRQ
jgi:hypothetical protein